MPPQLCPLLLPVCFQLCLLPLEPVDLLLVLHLHTNKHTRAHDAAWRWPVCLMPAFLACASVQPLSTMLCEVWRNNNRQCSPVAAASPLQVPAFPAELPVPCQPAEPPPAPTTAASPRTQWLPDRHPVGFIVSGCVRRYMHMYTQHGSSQRSRAQHSTLAA